MGYEGTRLGIAKVVILERVVYVVNVCRRGRFWPNLVGGVLGG